MISVKMHVKSDGESVNEFDLNTIKDTRTSIKQIYTGLCEEYKYHLSDRQQLVQQTQQNTDTKLHSTT